MAQKRAAKKVAGLLPNEETIAAANQAYAETVAQSPFPGATEQDRRYFAEHAARAAADRHERTQRCTAVWVMAAVCGDTCDRGELAYRVLSAMLRTLPAEHIERVLAELERK